MVDALEAYLFPGTVAENIRFGSRQRVEKLSVETIERQLERVGLAAYVGYGAANLSGGETQRVSLARTQANSPEVLLDELTSALEEATQRGVEDVICGVVEQPGLICSVVTRDTQQATRMATHVMVVERGRLVEFGAIEEVLNARPILS
jgi:putative ABC transport system ATP-binding protein